MTSEVLTTTEAGSARAPLTPMDRRWLERRSVRLDPRRHPAVSGAQAVAGLLRQAPPTTVKSRPIASHALAPSVVSGPLAPRGRLAPRSMTAAPLFRTMRHVRTAELLGTLASALDVAERLPRGHAVATAYIAVRLGADAGCDDAACADLLYAALLKDAGSTGHASPEAATTWSGSTPLPAHLSPLDRSAAVVRALGLPRAVADTVAAAAGASASADDRTAISARILRVSTAAAGAMLTGGRGDAERELRSARGSTLDPALVDLLLGMGRLGVWRELETPDLLSRLLKLEPAHLARVSDDAGMDAVAVVFADLVDTRTPRLGRHGRGVAALSAELGTALGLDAATLRDLHHAALLHDIGKLIVPIAVLEKRGQLSSAERSVVDQHARAGAAVLAGGPFSRDVARLVAVHHERLDGSGDLSGFSDDGHALAARVLAVADRYEALRATRPYRPALERQQALQVLAGSLSDPLALTVLRAVADRTETPGN